MPDASDAALLDTYGGLRARTVAYGHIHRAYVRRLPELTIANAGSAGMPYDGDPRPAYLLIDDETVEVRRVAYAVDDELAIHASSDYPYASWLAEIRRTGQYVSPPDT